MSHALAATACTGASPFSVTVISGGSPVVDATWAVDSFFDITWTPTDDIGVTSIAILLSLDGGMAFPETVATGEADDGLYDWYVDSDATVEARVDGGSYSSAATQRANHRDLRCIGPRNPQG